MEQYKVEKSSVLLTNIFANRVDRMKSSDIRELLKLISADVISFTGGAPDPDAFPSPDDLRDAVEYILANRDKAFQYGITDGLPGLRKSLIDFMYRQISIKADLPNVLITIGSQEGLEIVGRLFINQGDKVAVGLPTYLAALQAFNLWRPKYIGIPVDDNGLNTVILEEMVRKHKNTKKPIKFVYVVPTGQNPTGTIMSLDRRKHLLEIASKYDLFIVEDDPYGFITFRDDIPPRIKALDEEDRVIYLSTFSKIFAPGIRLGWVVANETLIKQMSLAIQAINLCPPNFNQYMVKYFLDNRLIDRNIPRIREIYRVKRDAMLSAMDEYMPKEVTYHRPDAGFFVFAYLPDYIDAKKLLYFAIEKEKVAFVPGRSFYVDGSGYNTMRLSYSLPKPRVIVEGIKRLAKVIRNSLMR